MPLAIPCVGTGDTGKPSPDNTSFAWVVRPSVQSCRIPLQSDDGIAPLPWGTTTFDRRSVWVVLHDKGTHGLMPTMHRNTDSHVNHFVPVGLLIRQCLAHACTHHTLVVPLDVPRHFFSIGAMESASWASGWAYNGARVPYGTGGDTFSYSSCGACVSGVG